MPGLLHTQPRGIIPRHSGRQLAEGFTIQARDVCIDHGDIEPIRVGAPIKTAVDDICTIYECGDDYMCWPDDVDLACGRVGGRNPMIVATEVPGFDFPVYSDPDEVCAGMWTRLGVACPDNIPTVSGGSGSCGPCDTPASYIYTYVNADGHESAPSPASGQTMVPERGGAVISGFAASPTVPNAGIRVYRSMSQGVSADAAGAAGHGWFLVGETVVGGAVVDAGTEEGCDLLISQDWFPPPADVTCVVEGQHGAMIATRKSDRTALLISEPGVPHAWPGDDDLCIKDNVVAIVEYDRDWYVLTDGHPYFIQVNRTASGPTYTVYRHPEPLPAFNKANVDVGHAGVVWASTDGAYVMKGRTVQNLTSEFISCKQWEGLNPRSIRGVVHKGAYYFTATRPIVDELTCEEMCSFIYKFGDGILGESDRGQLTSLSFKPKRWFHTRDHRLLYSIGNELFEFNPSDGEPLTYRYISRLHVSGYDTTWAAARIIHDNDSSTPTNFTIYCYDCRECDEARLIYTREINHCNPFRLPGCSSCDNIYWAIEGSDRIRSVHIASSISELRDGEFNGTTR